MTTPTGLNLAAVVDATITRRQKPPRPLTGYVVVAWTAETPEHDRDYYVVDPPGQADAVTCGALIEAHLRACDGCDFHD